MLKVVGQSCSPVATGIHSGTEFTEAFGHHSALIESYLQSHRIRNHSERTIRKESSFLKSWFEEYGSVACPLYTWEAMAPRTGRERIVQYGQALLDGQLSSDTVRSYLGILRNYFAFVLEHPFLKTSSGFVRIQNDNVRKAASLM